MTTILIDRVDLLDDLAAHRDADKIVVNLPHGSRDGGSLAALRDIDIAARLQQHGRVLEFGRTEGGQVVGAMTPCRRRGHVAVWTGYAIGPWHPSDITTRGLGGSETAAVRLAEEMAAMGYVVTLYGHFDQDELVDDVMLKHFDKYDPTQPLTAFIGFRNAMIFDQHPNAQFKALWLEDLPGAEMLSSSRAKVIDRICTVSGWHRDDTLAHYPMLDPGQVVACRNGITHQFFDGPAPEREKRVLYTSSPDRGLDVILRLWPRVREQVPDAELVSTYSRWYDLCADRWTEGARHRQMITELLEQEGVSRIKGGLGQRDLAHLMRSSTVWCHPSYFTMGGHPFHETSCISAMEAQAAGCVVVAAAQGALTETVQHGTLIDADPATPEFEDQFVSAIVQGLTDENTQLAAQTAGPEMVRDMDWRGAAEQLVGLFAPAVNGTVKLTDRDHV